MGHPDSIRAVLQLLYTGADAAEWLFPQEKASFSDAG
jgi:hypothetical protein